MQDENTHNTEPFAGEKSTPDILENSPKNKSFSRVSLKYGIGFIAIGALGVFGLWSLRNQIAKSSIQSYLKTKDIDAAIEFEDLQLNNAKFKNLVLSKNGKQTIDIKNGVLKWHIGKNNVLHIDEISAKNALFNFGINKQGFDFGALQPFLKGGDKKSNVNIGKIDIDNLIINISNQKDIYTINANLHGNGEKIIKASLLVNAPNKYFSKPIIIGAALSPLNQSPSKIGIKLITNENNIKAQENVIFKNSNANIWGEIETQKNKPIKINLFKTSLSVADFKNENIQIKNADILFKRGFFEIGNDIFKNIIFTFDGNLKTKNFKIAKNSISNIDLDFTSARAKNFQTRFATKGKIGNADFITKIATSEIAAIFDVNAPNLQNINNENIQAKFDLTLRKIENSNLSKLAKSLPTNSLDNLLSATNIQISANAKGNLNNFEVRPNGPMKIFTNANEFIKFENQNDTSILNFKSNNGQNDIVLFAKGLLSGNGKNGMSLNGKLNGLKFDENGFGILFDDFKLKNASIDNKNFDLTIENGKFSQSNNLQTNGDFKGFIKGNGENFSGLSNFEVKIKNNILNLKALGKFADLNINNAKAKNLDFSIMGNGNIKNAMAISGNAGFSNFYKDNIQINNGKGQFSAQIYPVQKQAKGEIIAEIANIKSEKLSSKNLKFNTKGSLNFANEIKYIGNISAGANDFKFDGDYFTAPHFDGDFATYFTKNGFKIASNNFNANIKEFKNKDLLLQNVRAIGPLNFAQNGSNIEINSSKCLTIWIDNFKTGSNIMRQTDGLLCPDNRGRLIAINNNDLNIFAQTDIGATTLILGLDENSPSVNIAQLKGGFISNSQGKNIFNGFANGLNFKFSTAPNEWAQIFAKNTDLVLNYGKNGTKINAKIANFSSDGLPVDIQGVLNGVFELKNGFSPVSEFDLSNLIIKDKEPNPRFAAFELNGRGELANQKLTIFGDANLNKNKKNIAQIYLDHNLNTGLGSVLIDSSKLEFSPKRPINLDIDDIIPAAQGIFVNSKGPMAATAKIEWAPNQELKSSAKITTKDFGFDGTLLSMSGIDGEIIINDLFKLKTPGQQNIKIKEMNPGLPIINGNLGFELMGDNAIDLKEISWTLADGLLELKPVKIPFATGPNQLEIIVTKIDIEKLLKLAKVPNIEVEAKMSGKLPVFIKDNSFEIIGGKLLADGEGVLRYTGPGIGSEKPKPKGFEKFKLKFTNGPPKDGTQLAIDALRDLRFKILEINVDGRLSGQMQFKILLEGSNPQLLDGNIFRFNIKIDIPLGEIISRYQSIFNPKLDLSKQIISPQQ